MTRAQIITDLMACLGSTGPASLKRGIHLVSQANELPALALYNQRVQTVDATGSTAERVMIMHLWGAASVRGGDYGPLDRLAAACAQALASPELNPHWDRTSLTRLELYEGGAADPVGLFDLQFSVVYESPLDTL